MIGRVIHWLLGLLPNSWTGESEPRVFDTPFPEAWQLHVDAQPFVRSLSPKQQDKLRHTLRVLVEEKSWEGCGGLEMTDEVRVTVATHAARLLLGLRHNYYRNVRRVLVYPSGFVNPMQSVDQSGVVSSGRAASGEAWVSGPVILSWDDVVRGARNPGDAHNVVLHEFAHKLDFLDRYGDGTPPLHSRQNYRRWQKIMTREYQALMADNQAGRRSVLDSYGTVNPAEFFAVATETFFEKASKLRGDRPQLYRLLRDYYGQDPAAPAGAR